MICFCCKNIFTFIFRRFCPECKICKKWFYAKVCYSCLECSWIPDICESETCQVLNIIE